MPGWVVFRALDIPVAQAIYSLMFDLLNILQPLHIPRVFLVLLAITLAWALLAPNLHY